MLPNQARSELQAFDLEVLGGNNQVNQALTEQIRSGVITLESARAIVSLRPAVKIWFKTRRDMEGFVTVLQTRILKANAVLFQTWTAEPFRYECDAMSSQVFAFAPYTVEDRALGQWSADMSVKFLSPEARALIQPGMFKHALKKFQYVIIAQKNFEVRDTRIHIDAAGELSERLDRNQLQQIVVDIDDI